MPLYSVVDVQLLLCLTHSKKTLFNFLYCLLRFYVVNPTNVGYDFSWESQGNPHPAWRCVTQRGMILAGKRGEMVFEYTPDDMEVAEVLRYFLLCLSIPEICRRSLCAVERSTVGWTATRLVCKPLQREKSSSWSNLNGTNYSYMQHSRFHVFFWHLFALISFSLFALQASVRNVTPVGPDLLSEEESNIDCDGFQSSWCECSQKRTI